MSTCFTTFPKIGIRPAIDGRRNGVRESLEDQTMGMAQAAADFFSANLRYPNGAPVRVRHRRHLHRRRGRSGRLRRASSPAPGWASRSPSPLLVLRLRDHGHGPAHPQGGLGLQRHRAPGRGLPGRRAGRPQPERPARLRHLRARRAGCRRYQHPRRCAGKTAALCPRRPGRWPCMRGKCYLSMGGVSMGIAGSIVDQTSSRATWACASKPST